MAKHDLTGNLEKDFTFSIEGKDFKFRKPTVREMRLIAKRFSGIDDESDPELQAERGDEAMRSLYGFITPVGHAEDIEAIMNDQPVGVQVAFNEMVQKELGA